MKSFSGRGLLAVVFLALLAAPAATRAGANPPAVTLSPGMTAEEIVKQIGRPAAVEPLPNTDGKAERWTYRKRVPAKTPASPDAKPGLTRTYAVLTLLIIEDKLVVARETTEEKTADGK